MTKVYRALVAVLFLSTASAFSIPDSFHLMQTAASSVAHQLPHVDLLSAYKSQLVANPLPTKCLTGATLAVAGDAIAQSQAKDEAYDERRAVSFAVFDMAYRSLQHFSFPIIVAHCHGQFLDSSPLLHGNIDLSNLAALEQTLASQLGIVPFMYYPAFFALTGAIQGLSIEGAAIRAKENFVPLMKRNLLFWIPVQFIQFGYIQEDLQIPFLSLCGLGWTFILSIAAGSAKKYSPSPEDEVVEEMMRSTEPTDTVPSPGAQTANANAI